MTSTCRSCGAEVVWVKTVNGKNHPLDATPIPAGEWQIRPSVAGPLMTKVTPLTEADAPRFTSHFATCPNADEHRKGRPSKGVRAHG